MIEPTSQELADWFFNSGTWRKTQGADGFNYAKNDDRGYVYVWVMAHVDMDLTQHYLLDVRVSQPDDTWEHRHFLYVSIDAWHNESVKNELVGDRIKFNADANEHKNRLDIGLHRFAEIVVQSQFEE